MKKLFSIILIVFVFHLILVVNAEDQFSDYNDDSNEELYEYSFNPTSPTAKEELRYWSLKKKWLRKQVECIDIVKDIDNKIEKELIDWINETHVLDQKLESISDITLDEIQKNANTSQPLTNAEITAMMKPLEDTLSQKIDEYGDQINPLNHEEAIQSISEILYLYADLRDKNAELQTLFESEPEKKQYFKDINLRTELLENNFELNIAFIENNRLADVIMIKEISKYRISMHQLLYATNADELIEAITSFEYLARYEVNHFTNRGNMYAKWLIAMTLMGTPNQNKVTLEKNPINTQKAYQYFDEASASGLAKSMGISALIEKDRKDPNMRKVLKYAIFARDYKNKHAIMMLENAEKLCKDRVIDFDSFQRINFLQY